ncbi:MAG: GntR family transcriptional regulator [Rhodobiaceae bacterium]|nr:GntR family transcriptional regulator [Rhodobiaceae bacterium]
MPRPPATDAALDLDDVLSGAAIDRTRAIAPQIYAALRARIIDNTLPPGAHLSESEIARSLGISRTPLRAALQQLAGEGLLIIQPQVASVVAPLDEGRLREAVFVRIAIEEAVVRRLAGTGIDDAALAPVLASQQVAAERDDYATFFVHDETFHAMLAEQAGVPNAWGLVQSMKAHVDRQRLRLTKSIPGRSLRAYRMHLAILDHIRSGDGEAAARAMRDHINSVLDTPGVHDDSAGKTLEDALPAG